MGFHHNRGSSCLCFLAVWSHTRAGTFNTVMDIVYIFTRMGDNDGYEVSQWNQKGLPDT